MKICYKLNKIDGIPVSSNRATQALCLRCLCDKPHGKDEGSAKQKKNSEKISEKKLFNHWLIISCEVDIVTCYIRTRLNYAV